MTFEMLQEKASSNQYSLQTVHFLTCGSFSFSTNDACFEPLRWTGFESKGLKKVQDNLRYNNRSFKE
jgi:hypothetical protein